MVLDRIFIQVLLQSIRKHDTSNLLQNINHDFFIYPVSHNDAACLRMSSVTLQNLSDKRIDFLFIAFLHCLSVAFILAFLFFIRLLQPFAAAAHLLPRLLHPSYLPEPSLFQILRLQLLPHAGISSIISFASSALPLSLLRSCTGTSSVTSSDRASLSSTIFLCHIGAFCITFRFCCFFHSLDVALFL